MKKYLLLIVYVFMFCSVADATPVFIAKGTQQVEFDYDIGVSPESVYQEDIHIPFNKNGSGVICFFKFDTYTRQLPYMDYSAYNKYEQYEAIYSQSENLLIFRRTIFNASNEIWTPGIRTKFAKWFLLK